MIQKDFEKLWHETVDTCFKLGNSKGAEYAHGQDRLDNFKRHAKNVGVHPYTVWSIYAGKHWDSISIFINDKQSGKTRKYSEHIEGRIHDMIVYLILLKALIEDVESSSLTEASSPPAQPTEGEKKNIGIASFNDRSKKDPEWMANFYKLVDDFVDKAKGNAPKLSTTYYPITDSTDFLNRLEEAKKNGVVPSARLDVALYFIRNGHAVWDGNRPLPLSFVVFESYLQRPVGGNTADNPPDK